MLKSLSLGDDFLFTVNKCRSLFVYTIKIAVMMMLNVDVKNWHFIHKSSSSAAQLSICLSVCPSCPAIFSRILPHSVFYDTISVVLFLKF